MSADEVTAQRRLCSPTVQTSEDSHSHCFRFNLQTASMFYVKRSWQLTLFLYVFIIQDERWRNKRRSVKVKCGTLLTSGREAPGASPNPKGCSVVSPSLLLTPSASRLPIEPKAEELFHRSRLRIDWAGCRGVSEVAGFHLWDPKRGCFNKWWAADDRGQRRSISDVFTHTHIISGTLFDEASRNVYNTRLILHHLVFMYPEVTIFGKEDTE